MKHETMTSEFPWVCLLHLSPSLVLVSSYLHGDKMDVALDKYYRYFSIYNSWTCGLPSSIHSIDPFLLCTFYDPSCPLLQIHCILLGGDPSYTGSRSFEYFSSPSVSCCLNWKLRIGVESSNIWYRLQVV